MNSQGSNDGSAVGGLESLFTPWVMKAAFQKVEQWYATGELRDPGEWLEWQAHMWARLSSLASDLANGRYKPGPFPVVPYPKRGGRTRHYVMPSVRDQVAFMAYMVLLGPFLEARMPNVSFGNRLFRPRIQWTQPSGDDSEEAAKQRWYRAPFSLGEPRLYDNFQSGYGLFRRVAQWLVNAQVLGEDTAGINRDEMEVEPPDLLPYHQHLSRPVRKGGSDLYYARLDVELAYPAVSRKTLAAELVRLVCCEPGPNPSTERNDAKGEKQDQWGRPSFPSLGLQGGPFDNTVERANPGTGEHPWTQLANHGPLRKLLANRLGELLRGISYAAWCAPSEPAADWRAEVHDANWHMKHCAADHGPSHDTKAPQRSQDELEENADPYGFWPVNSLAGHYVKDNAFGIPTGLAISGALLNVALTRVDEELCEYHNNNTKIDDAVFFLRYVDDIMVFATNQNLLWHSIDVLQGELKNASPEFSISKAKAKPKVVSQVLASQDKIEDVNGGAVHSTRPDIPPGQILTRGNLDKFISHVVREVSDLSEEGLDESFGAPAIERLEDLMELALRHDDDPEVQAEARVSFALHRLARASWPDRPVRVGDTDWNPEAFVRQILSTAEQALRRYPARYKLWRPVLVCAVRADALGAGAIGTQWLEQRILPLLAHVDERHRKEVLQGCVPESSVSFAALGDRGSLAEEHPWSSDCQAVRALRWQNAELRNSFRRAYFWREWASLRRQLEALAMGQPANPSTWTWYLTADQASTCLGHIGGWARWARVLYGYAQDPAWLWWWEAECLSEALVAASPPTNALLGRLGPPRPEVFRRSTAIVGHAVGQQKGPGLDWLKRAAAHVVGYEGQAENDASPARESESPTILWLTRVSQDRRGRKTFCIPKDRIPDNPVGWAAVAQMGLWDIYPDLARRVWEKPLQRPALAGQPPRLWDALYRLEAYAKIRRMLQGHGYVVSWRQFPAWFPEHSTQSDGEGECVTLLDSMYRMDRSHQTPPDANVPALELPSPYAWRLVQDVKDLAQDSCSRHFVAPDCIEMSGSGDLWLSGLRRRMLCVEQPGESAEKEAKCHGPRVTRVNGLRPGRRAPHPLYLMPELLDICREDAARWRRACLLLWMVSGGEHLLDQVFRRAPWHVPLSDREAYRSRFVLPREAWELVDEGLRSPRKSLFLAREPDPIALEQRDVDLLNAPSGATFIPTDVCVSSRGSQALNQVLPIRLVQVASQPDWPSWLASFRSAAGRRQAVRRSTFGKLTEELGERLREVTAQARAGDYQGNRDALVMFPEWSFPYPLAPKVRQFVRRTGVGVLAGLTPRPLPSTVPVARVQSTARLRLLVNEAILVLPSSAPRQQPWNTHEFRIVKPRPNAGEVGLEQSLSSGNTQQWRFVRGMRWWRFRVPGWGSFAPVICSDLLDSGPHVWLRGRIHHLLVVAWNQDVDLYDQFTWTRGYELYCNVALVNHGSHGGSVVWTPKHGLDKEVFRVHGQGQGLAVTVQLPVASLDVAQRGQWEASVAAHAAEWTERAHAQSSSVILPDKFKTPPFELR